MNFTIKCNNKCFFYIPLSACNHFGHREESEEDMKNKGKHRLLPEEEETRKKMSRISTSSGGMSTAIGMNREFGQMYSRQFLKNRSSTDTINASSTLTKSALHSCNDAEGIQNYLIKNHNCRVVVMRTLQHSDQKEDVCNVSVESSLCASDRTETVIVPPDEDALEVREYISKTQARNRDKALLSLAWMTPSQLRLAKAFNLAISIDSTHKACQLDNLSLMTVTVKDSFGQTYVIVSFWIPNQKTWMFRYVLMESIPRMVGRDVCLNVRAIISDGDRQICRAIDVAIQTYYCNAIRLPCTWHIVCPPMRHLHRNIITKKNVSSYWLQWFLCVIQIWVYSFMKSGRGIESDDEYKVSKALLKAFI